MEKKEIILTKKIENEELQGEIKYAALSYPERIAYSKKSLTTIVEGEKGQEVRLNENLDRAVEYYELACAQIKNIDVKIVCEDRVLSTVDELMIYAQGQEVIMEIATDLISGIVLGNGKLKELDKTV